MVGLLCVSSAASSGFGISLTSVNEESFSESVLKSSSFSINSPRASYFARLDSLRR
jgi:hypothetical protein